MPVCYNCSTKFSLLNREKSCQTCGLSFCSRCLVKLNTSYKCSKCVSQTTTPVYDPPAALIKRLQALDDPSRPPVTVFSNKSGPLTGLGSGLEPKDAALVSRLEKLKEKPKKILSEEEIRTRLNLLKGIDQIPQESAVAAGTDVRSSQPPAGPADPPITEQGQVEALLAQYMASTSINPESQTVSDDDDDEQSAVAAVLRRAAAEAALPPTDDVTLSPPPSPPVPMEEELPWCELCNGDATLRCDTCDSALYCRRCYKETHTGADSDHVTHKYP